MRLEWTTPGVADAALAHSVAGASSVLDGAGFDFDREAAGSGRTVLLSFPEVLALFPEADLPLVESHAGSPAAARLPVGHTAGGVPIELPVEPDQGRHLVLVGETGMGKSSLQIALAVRVARSAPVVVLDPMGETAESIRSELQRQGRAVRWIAPGAAGVGMNALAGVGRALQNDPVRAERELSALVHALRRVRGGRFTDRAFWGPRLEEMVGRALRAAASLPGGTLEDAHGMLCRAPDGRAVVPAAATRAWHDLAARVRERPDDAEGARRLLFEVVHDPTLRAMLSSRAPELSLPELVSGDRPTLVSGSATRVGESTARYLLSTYLALLWSELLSRPCRAKTFVFLDEAQWFAHEGVGEMLRLSRRLNVHLVVATQSLLSLPDDVAEVARTNVADWVLFRGAAADVRELARGVPSVRADALAALPRGEALVLLGKGERSHWVRTARLPQGLLGPTKPGPLGAADDRREPAAAAPSPVGSLTVDGLIARLRSRAGPPPLSGLVEVPLRTLRAEGVTAERIRTLGGELGRRGAIVGRSGEPGDAAWLVDLRRLGERPARPTAAEPARASDTTQHL